MLTGFLKPCLPFCQSKQQKMQYQAEAPCAANNCFPQNLESLIEAVFKQCLIRPFTLLIALLQTKISEVINPGSVKTSPFGPFHAF